MEGIHLNKESNKVVIQGLRPYSFSFLSLEDANEGFNVISKYYEKSINDNKPLDWKSIDKELTSKNIKYL